MASTFRLVLSNEVRVLARERAAWLLAGLIALLIGGALVNGAQHTRAQAATAAQVAQADRARVDDLAAAIARIEEGASPPASPFRDPTHPAAVGRSLGAQTVALRPAPLALTAVGQSDLFPSYALITTATADPLLSTPTLANPRALLAGPFDLAFVVAYLLPLMALGLGYGVLSSERERGTLDLVMSQPVRASEVMAGKLAALGLVVLGTTFASTGIGLAALGVDLARPGALVALGTWCAVVTLYVAFWLALALAWNLRGRSSAENAVALAAAWVALAVLIPGGLNAIAVLRHPVPSRVEMVGVEREAAREAQAQGAAVLAAYYEEHPELAPPSQTTVDFAARSWAIQEAVDRRVREVRVRYDREAASQRALWHAWRFVSPTLLARAALLDLAGTGDARYAGYRAVVGEVHADWRAHFGAKIARQERMRADDLAALSSLVPPDLGGDDAAFEPRGALYRRLGAHLAGLAAMLLAVAAISARSSRRARLRASGLDP